MAFDNKNRVSIWKNEEKEKESHKDYRGDVHVECPHCGELASFWLSLWKSDGTNAKAPVLSGSIQYKEPRTGPVGGGNVKGKGKGKPGRPQPEDDEIPF